VTDPKTELERLLTAHARAELPSLPGVEVKLERPREASHGDFATNVALTAAKAQKRAPRHVPQALVARAKADGAGGAQVDAI